MDSLETPYEDDSATDFIECTVCDKSARGLSLYKIHLTTQGHLKKEEAVIAAGAGVGERSVPVFKDILHYLDYLKLDEPIIGLNYVEEVYSHTPNSDLGPKYTCILCNTTAHLPEVVSHIIGRKHRQKYMESKRPDLVTWDKDSLMAQGGKMIRTRAEIIERQDGRGHPVILTKWENVGQISAPPRPRQNGNPQKPPTLFQLDLPACPPKRQDFAESQRGMLPPDHSHRTSFPPGEARGLSADRQTYQQEDWQREVSRRQDLDYRQQESQTRGVDPREEVPHGGWAQRYPDEAPPYRWTSLESSDAKEDVRHGSSSDYQHPSYQEDERRWSLDPSVNTIGDRVRLGSSVPEPPKGSLPSHPHAERPRGHVRDYQHGEARQGQLLSNPAPLDWSGPVQTPREDSRGMSDIPEPFRRFMKWPGDDDDSGEACGKRKRKSRFSDATAEEVEVAHKILNAGYGPPDPKLRAHSRSGGGPFEAETRGPVRHPDRFLESQDSHLSDSLQKDGPEKETVFDMLNEIEIESVEEATFLKNKLTSLLKEFKALKSKKMEQKSPAPQMSAQQQHGRPPWGDSDFRRTEEDDRGRMWRTQETNVRGGQQEYQHHMRGEPGASNRSRYEGVSAPREMYPPRRPDERAQRPERFQENAAAHRDLRPVSQGYFDPRPAPPLPRDMERGVAMSRGPQYSKSLEKLTSTLLELVSRKQQ